MLRTSDIHLGDRIKAALIAKGLETPRNIATFLDGAAPQSRIEQLMGEIMVTLGLDLSDDSLMDTPKRVAKMYCKELFMGLDYANFPKCTVVENKMHYDEIICEVNVQVQSMCEHHLLPIIGTATVAYIPKDKVLGLSKMNRIVDFFCRRPQIQERLTEQVAAAMQTILETDDVAVIINAEHFCVKMRGVEDPCSSTITSKMLGRFRENPETRAELLTLTMGSQV